MSQAVVLAPLVVAVALLLSATAKLRDPAALRLAAVDLGVPGWLRHRAVLRVVPWVEGVLGVALVVAPGPVPAILATGLLLAYTALVVRAVVRGDDATCGCFGPDEPVGPRTVVRNLLLLGAAAVAVVAALDTAPLARLRRLDGVDAWWLAGAAAVAVLVGVTAPLGTRRASSPYDDGARGIPYLPVTHADGTTTSLPELASLRAQLLVHLSDTCQPCEAVTAVVGDWPAEVPAIDVRVLTDKPLGASLPAAWPGVVHDPERRVAAVLGLVRPSAVLLGADALIAGGPVHGADAVLELFAEVRAALAQDAEDR